MPSSNIRKSGVIDLDQEQAHTSVAPKDLILGIITARATRSGIPWLYGSAREQCAELVAVGNTLVDASQCRGSLRRYHCIPLVVTQETRAPNLGKFVGKEMERGQNLGIRCYRLRTKAHNRSSISKDMGLIVDTACWPQTEHDLLALPPFRDPSRSTLRPVEPTHL